MINYRLLQQAAPARAALVATIACSCLGGLFVLSQAWLLSATIDRVFLRGATLAQVAPLLACLLGVIVARGAVTWGGEVTASAVARRVKQDLREAVFRHLLALGPAYTQGERTGELTTAVVDGVEALVPYFSQYLPQLAAATLIPLTILLVVFPLDWLSAVVFLVTAPLIPFFMWLIGQTTAALTHKQYDLLGRLNAHFLDTLQGLATLKILGQSRAQAESIGQVGDQYRQATLGVLRVAFLSALVLELVATISTALVAVEVSLRLLYGRMAFQPALCILILAPEFYLPLRMLGLRFHAAASGVSAAKRIFEILAAPGAAPPALLAPQSASFAPQFNCGANGALLTPQFNCGANGALLTPQFNCGANRVSETAPVLRDITFKDVHFTYPDGRPALRGVSFEIPVGRKTALVGPSGAGKSTVAQLLLRFIEPGAGEISAGGAPLREIDPDAWRAQMAWVPQAPHLFHTTLAANLRLACPAASDAEVQRAAHLAQLHDWVVSLPQGYATLVGEGGARLSAGQAQRLALARAFLKNAPLLLLDEPTSNVDPELEALLQAATDRLMLGRTTLVIAHRLSTIYQADQIIVLAEGRVAESGQHVSLLQQRGLYHQLVTAGLP